MLFYLLLKSFSSTSPISFILTFSSFVAVFVSLKFGFGFKEVKSLVKVNFGYGFMFIDLV